MPRNYKKKLGFAGKRNYDVVFLERAVAAVKCGRLSMRGAAEQYAVPYTTLNRKVHGKNPLKYGRQPVLNEKVEKLLVDCLHLCAEWGFPLKSTDIRQMVQQYLNKCGNIEPRFKDNMPGIDWLKCFMLRHPELTIKFAENTKRVRATVGYEVVQNYFKELENSLKDLPASNIINYDESNFVDDPGKKRVVVKRGVKHVHRIMDTSKTSTSVMFAISADGNLLPPYIVYKAKHLYPGWTEGGIEGARNNRTKSGWFDSFMFEDWFINIILSYVRKFKGPKLIIGDNLSSHLTLSVIQECEKNQIRFVLLPPNSTHILQPLDVAYFRPLKAAWRDCLERWKLKNRGVLPKTVFPRMLKETVEKVGAKSAANSIAGFRACGIVPFDPSVVLKKIPHKAATDENEKSWTEVIINHLNSMRRGSENETSKGKRGKKANITPGKSASAADLLT